MEKLAENGLIVRQAGRGSFVATKRSKLPKSAGETSKKHYLIGLIMHGFADDYGRELLYSLEANTPPGYSLVLRISDGNTEIEQRAIRELIEANVDGLIIAPAQAEHYSKDLLQLVINEFPLVIIDRFFKGIASSSVATDNLKATKEATKYLFDLKHRSIALLTPLSHSTTAIEDRIEGFIQAHAEAGILADNQLIIDSMVCFAHPSEEKMTSDRERIKQLIVRKPELSAFLACEYPLAILAKEAIDELGLKVPNDFSILCFDSPRFRLDRTNFTHVRQNEELIGKKSDGDSQRLNQL